MSLALQETDDFIGETLSRPLHVLYQDEHILAVFKPAGLIVHRSKLTLPHEPVLLQALRDQIGKFVYPVHRLDRPTAGIVLFGLHSEAAAKLVQRFTDRHIAKYYQALVRGFTDDTFVVDRPLQDKFGEEWDPGSTEGNPLQEACTEFQSLQRFEVPWESNGFPSSRYSLLEIKPITGRWHQIRRHLNHVANPVIGDHRHGDHRHNQMMHQMTGVYRMLLTAVRIDLRHPYTDEMLTVAAGRGSEFDRAIEALRALSVS